MRNDRPRAKFFVDILDINSAAWKEISRLKELRDAAYRKNDPDGRLPFGDALYTCPIRKIDPSLVPMGAKIKKGKEKYLTGINNLVEYFIVSEVVKQIIDRCGDSKVNFFNFIIESENTNYQFYIAQIERCLNCIDYEKSGYQKNLRQDGSVYYTAPPYVKDVFINRSAVGGRHLWLGDGLGWFFVSDQLGPLIAPHLPKGFSLVEVSWS